MKTCRRFLGLTLAALLALGNTFAMAAPMVDLNALTLDELVEKAKLDGEVNSVGMPDNWANWGETWQELTATYGIAHTDVDMSSAEELAIFESEKANATKDIGDVGQSFGPVAVVQGLAASYKDQLLGQHPRLGQGYGWQLDHRLLRHHEHHGQRRSGGGRFPRASRIS